MMQPKPKKGLYSIKHESGIVEQDESSGHFEVQRIAKDVFLEQASVMETLAERVDDSFSRALHLLLSARGHVVILGVGKSGIIGKKIAATWSSTGTPSIFVHAGEAVHGDLGIITDRDVALLISYSGETDETVRLLPHLRKLKIPLIAMVGSPNSTLATSVDVTLDVSVEKEACPNNLAPTHSTLATLAMGDALAVSMMRLRGFRSDDFARFHPGGALGKKIHCRVKDAMRKVDLPITGPESTIGESLVIMTRGRLGLVLVIDNDRFVGLMTDGDLRRAMQCYEDVLNVPVSKVMTMNPVTIVEDMSIEEARFRMKRMKLKAFVVKNSDGDVVGVLDLFHK